MQPVLPLFPESASSMAGRVDALLFFLLGVAAFFSLLIGLGIFYLSFKYRRRPDNQVGQLVPGSHFLEIAWMVVPLILAMFMFGWGAKLYVAGRRPPKDAAEVFVVAKQWMWKIQHPGGRREFNELHVPVDRDIRLTMTSEDVIHDFFVPAFRMKMDVLPGRYTSAWFRATKTGRYHLFCAQYCGTNHALMGGWVVVMKPAEYQAWVGGGQAGESLQQAGERLFTQLACVTCHAEGPQQRGPSLRGLFGSTVRLENGATVIADEAYLHESILNPRAKIVAGYQPLMPTFQGIVSEDQVMQLIAYIKTLSLPQNTTFRGPRSAARRQGEEMRERP